LELLHCSALADAQKLRRSGYVVVALRTGYEVLDRLAGTLLGVSDSFDLILSDVRMPGYSGLDLLSRAAG